MLWSHIELSVYTSESVDINKGSTSLWQSTVALEIQLIAKLIITSCVVLQSVKTQTIAECLYELTMVNQHVWNYGFNEPKIVVFLWVQTCYPFPMVLGNTFVLSKLRSWNMKIENNWNALWIKPLTLGKLYPEKARESRSPACQHSLNPDHLTSSACSTAVWRALLSFILLVIRSLSLECFSGGTLSSSA